MAGAMRVHVYNSTHSHWLQIFTHTLGQSLLFVSLLEAPAKLHDVKIMAMYADASMKIRWNQSGLHRRSLPCQSRHCSS